MGLLKPSIDYDPFAIDDVEPKPMFEIDAPEDIRAYYFLESNIVWRGHKTNRKSLFSKTFTKNDIIIHLTSKYRIPNFIRKMRSIIIEFWKKECDIKFGNPPKIWNGNIVSLSQYSLSESYLTLHVRKTEFYDVLASNYSLDLKHNFYNRTLRYYYARGPLLQEFTDSLLANQIGLGGFVITADNYIIFQKRSSQTLVDQNIVTHSLAGIVKYSDEYFTDNTPDLFKSFKAQAKEELAIDSDMFTSVNIIGANRNLIRGGSPSFRFIAILNVTKTQLVQNMLSNPPIDNWEHKELIWKQIHEPISVNATSNLDILENCIAELNLNSISISTIYHLDRYWNELI